MVALLWAEGNASGAIQLERLWNELAHTHSFTLLCAYPMKSFGVRRPSTEIELVCDEHTSVLASESHTSLGSEDERMRSIAILQQKALALEAEIEERKAIAAELARREVELRDAVAARDEFLSVAAHELRTPLTGLRLVAQLLVRERDLNRELSAERLDAAMRALDSQTQKLNELVARLLDRSQIEAGRLRVQPRPTDLVALVRSVLDERYQGNRTRFVFEAPDQIEVAVDEIRFEQVISNLLANAVKFSPPDAEVRIDLERTSAGGIRLSVTDHGVGIPLDQREAVFERFHQAHADPHRVGMGLGLYISAEIVRLHGGTIRIEDPDHPGTRMVVTLPPTGAAAQAA
jgi:signal transduction histidine kinase